MMFLFQDTFWKDTYLRLNRFVIGKDTILDIGSLNAPYTRCFQNLIVAIDLPGKGRFGFSNKVLCELKSKRNFIPVMASAEMIPFKEKFFDKIVLTEVLEHIHCDETAVSEMARVLRNDGKVFLSTPNGNEIPLQQGIPEHIRHYSEKELEKLLGRFFRKTTIIKRFPFRHFLRIQWRFYGRTRVQNLIAGVLISFLYLGILFLTEIFHIGKGYYNLVAYAENPLYLIDR